MMGVFSKYNANINNLAIIKKTNLIDGSVNNLIMSPLRKINYNFVKKHKSLLSNYEIDNISDINKEFLSGESSVDKGLIADALIRLLPSAEQALLNLIKLPKIKKMINFNFVNTSGHNLWFYALKNRAIDLIG